MAAVSKPAGGKIGLMWPLAFHLINSIAFAHMLPVSLAFFAKLAPAKANTAAILTTKLRISPAWLCCIYVTQLYQRPIRDSN